jgi:PAS domain S-box-containing protein
MWFLANKSIQRKVMVVILLTSSAALIVSAGALLAFQLLTFRKSFQHDLSSIGQVISKQAGMAVLFTMPKEATDLLGALEAKPHVLGAEIVLPDETVFATYGKPAEIRGPKFKGRRWGVWFQGKDLIYSQRLIDPSDQSPIGALFLRSDYNKEFLALLRLYAGVVGIVLSLSFVLTLLLSSRLQRVISEPILSLAKTAQVVADQKDYSVRAEKLEEDEIGLFTEAFNQMLGEIQAQHAELRKSQQKIETLVNSIEGVVWEADPQTLRFTFVSQHAERLLGYPPEQWLEDPNFWRAHLHPEDREKTLDITRMAVALKKPYCLEYRMVAADNAVLWMRNYTTVVLEDGLPALVRGVLLDITKERKAAEELKTLHAELLQASRQAGMAEVATGVLHNVGNVLNSVNVSSALVHDKIRKSEVASLAKVATMLRSHARDFPAFLARDPKGRKLPEFIVSLAEHMSREQEETLKELELLSRNIEHIKDIVAMQQSYARVVGMIELLPPQTLIHDALRIHSTDGTRQSIEITTDLEEVPAVAVDKHKALQILVNLLANAKQALQESGRPDKAVKISLSRNDGHVRITVQDNGIGIPPENLTRIFRHGFTTKKDGHGFGLHSGALAAKEMGGSLVAQSDGVGKGAAFILELPIPPSSSDKPNEP